jgi:hypothetical protein
MRKRRVTLTITTFGLATVFLIGGTAMAQAPLVEPSNRDWPAQSHAVPAPRLDPIVARNARHAGIQGERLLADRDFAQTRDWKFEETGCAQFMASPAGRLLRVAAGGVMIGVGVDRGGSGGTALAIAGGIPLAAGAFDVCVLSALFGGPFRGEDIRRTRRQ